MAKIPFYEGEQSFQAVPSVQPNAAMLPDGSMLQEQGKILQDAAQKFGEIQKARESLRAQADAKMALADLEREEELDPDSTNYEEYRKRSEKIISESLSGITDKITRETTQQQLNLDAYNANSRILKSKRLKEIDGARAENARMIAESKRIAVYSTDPAELQKQYDDAVAGINDLKNKGVYSETDAQKLIASIAPDWEEDKARVMAETDPQGTIDALNSGKFPHMDVEVKNQVIKFAQQKMKINTTADVQQRREMRNTIGADIFSGKITSPMQIKEAMGAKFDLKEFETLEKFLVNSNPVGSDMEYLGYIKELASAPDMSKKEAEAFYYKVGESKALSSTQKKSILYGEAVGETGLSVIEIAVKPEKKPFFQCLSKILESFSMREVNLVLAVNNYIKSINKDDTPADVEKKANKAIMSTHENINPHLRSIGSEPQLYFDGVNYAYGTRGEDGDITWESAEEEESNNEDEDEIGEDFGEDSEE